MKDEYKAEIKVGKKWESLSIHSDKDIAVINAEVTSRSRKCPARVLYRGKTVFEIKPK